ncbi:hypothetical protein TEA_010884 [Camellia sinensis var. sinensis]|uniref:3-methyl-2-oxobutanoate hydroxymethyltransferase n=1 Tax=Camellia sinensis var. sinensis TaxID=542762 RepID=A0A4V3WNE1_CAMSN|nr:hypothetical protein TEA_010884 [Camellia sinensis var. sinensis]
MYYLINAEFCRWETLLSRSWKKTLMLPRRLRETGGSNRVAHIGYFAQSNLSNYVFWFSHSDRFSRSLLRRMLSRLCLDLVFAEGKVNEVVEFALALQEAGCFSVVLECMLASVAAAATFALRIPTIGIGTRPFCIGQVN